MMDLVSTAELLGNFGEFVGAVAVVLSLVYLAIQLRQNTKALRAGSTWEAENLWGHLNYENAKDPKLAILLTKILSEEAEPNELSAEELAQTRFWVRSILQFQQSQYLLWRDGSLPTEYYETRKAWVRWFAGLPIVDPVIAAERENGILYPEFDARVLQAGAHDE